VPDWAQQAADRLDALGDSPTPAEVRVVTDRFEDTDLMAAIHSIAKAGGGGGGGSSAFNGCRYAMGEVPGGDTYTSLNSSGNLALWMNNAQPFYDTDNYASGGFDNTGDTNDGYLHAPADGYYRISASISVDFSGSDSTFIDGIITSPDRDSEWDIVDHFTVYPLTGHNGAGGMTVTHWLQAGDRVYVQTGRDGTTAPTGIGAIEMQFLGTGANPAA
jgi:hypothetical protein